MDECGAWRSGSSGVGAGAAGRSLALSFILTLLLCIDVPYLSTARLEQAVEGWLLLARIRSEPER